jgi:DNA repair protein RecO (recombination protein O)
MSDGDAARRPPRPRAGSRSGDTRIDQQPAFVLHATAWRETSLIVEVLTRDFGRVALVARGAKRPTSQLRGMVSPFCALSLAWSGRGEIKTLMRAEWNGSLAPLRGEALLAGFYMNELLVRLLARADPHPQLFAGYAGSLRELSSPAQSLEASIRRFELLLLRELGVLPSLEHDDDGAEIDARRQYRVDGGRGLVAVAGDAEAGGSLLVGGATIMALADDSALSLDQAGEARNLLRTLIRYHLDGRPLNTRRILQDLREL